MSRRLSLAAQLLVLQMVIVVVVVAGVAMVTLAQERTRFRDTEGRRALAVAETIASSDVVRGAALDHQSLSALRTVAENTRVSSASTYVIVVDSDLVVLASSDPSILDTTRQLHSPTMVSGRSWSGVAPERVDGQIRDVVVAEVPVMNADPDQGRVGEVIAAVEVGRAVPSVRQTLTLAAPTLLTYLGLAGLVSLLGCILIARRVRRQTLGLDPYEIVGLVEQRNATLHSIREGLIALDLRRRVTLINDEAATLLGLSPDVVGQPIDELPLHQDVVAALTRTSRQGDQVLPVAGRLLILNSKPTVNRGQRIGSVTTLRDRTELMALQRELDVTTHATDTLRAQAHEFSNRLHTISGLIELREYDEVARFVRRVDGGLSRFTDNVAGHIHDPSVAALLIAKGAQAHERGVRFVVSAASHLGAVDEAVSTDVSTVVGNLVDNAFDAVGEPRGEATAALSDEGRQPTVEVKITDGSDEVLVEVRDNGRGVDPEQTEALFQRGFSTKNAAGERGIGLSLVRLVCRRRGGWVSVYNDDGAVFVACLPSRAHVTR